MMTVKCPGFITMKIVHHPQRI